MDCFRPQCSTGSDHFLDLLNDDVDQPLPPLPPIQDINPLRLLHLHHNLPSLLRPDDPVHLQAENTLSLMIPYLSESRIFIMVAVDLSPAAPIEAPAVDFTPAVTADAPPAKPTKVKSTKAQKEKMVSMKKPTMYPPYLEMIGKDMISSQYTISKFMEDKHKAYLPANFKKLIVQLRKLIVAGKLTKVTNSYKISANPPLL